MVKFFLIAISFLSIDEMHAQDIKKNGHLNLSIGIIPYKQGESHHYFRLEIRVPSFEATRPAAHPFFTIQNGSDERIPNSTTTSADAGIYCGTDKLHVLLQSGILWSCNGGYKGWNAYNITVAGTYAFWGMTGTYLANGQYTLTTNYDFSHIIIKPKQSDYVRTKTEVTLNVTKFLAFGYATNFFKETMKKDEVNNGMRRSMPIEHNFDCGRFVMITFKNVYMKLYTPQNSLQKISFCFGNT